MDKDYAAMYLTIYYTHVLHTQSVCGFKCQNVCFCPYACLASRLFLCKYSRKLLFVCLCLLLSKRQVCVCFLILIYTVCKQCLVCVCVCVCVQGSN